MGTKLNQPLLIGLGALWGLVEATLGWGMHLLHIPFRSLFLFPIGLFFMLYGVYHVGEARAALRIATVAALIKLTNLMMPGYFPVYYVVNPAVAIWLEGAAVFVFSYFFITNRKKMPQGIVLPFITALGLVILLQILFSGWQVIMSRLTVGNPALVREFSIGNIFPFMIQSLLKGGFVVLIARLLQSSTENRWEIRLNWGWSVSLVVLAMIVDYITL